MQHAGSHPEDGTRRLYGRDLSWHTWHIWARLYSAAYGTPPQGVQLSHPCFGGPPDDYTAPPAAVAPRGITQMPTHGAHLDT